MDVWGQAGECVRMPTDMVEEVRPPRAHGDDVHQHIAFEVASVQQMSAQGRRSAEIVRHHTGAVEPPMVEHESERLALNVERCALIPAHLGLSVAGHVVPMDVEPLGQRGDDPVPCEG